MAQIRDKVMTSTEQLAERVDFWKSTGKKIVFTNGCFDLIHVGHVLYLESAAMLGDVLIVGLNSDTSVRRLKGSGRPINDQMNRSCVLAALSSVDAVIVFEEDDPLRLITEICPDILVKGGDWKPEQIVGSDFVLKNGGEVKSLQFVDGYSTTSIEKKIKGV